jgi:hypothetical protein
MLCIEELIDLDLFEQLSKEQLEWICDRAQTDELGTGEVLTHKGEPGYGLFSLVKGNRLLVEVGERGRVKGERDEIFPFPLPFNLSPTSCKSSFCKMSNESYPLDRKS